MQALIIINHGRNIHVTLFARSAAYRIMADSNHNCIFPYADFLQALSSLYDPDTLELTYPELLQKCLHVAASVKVSNK